MDKVTIPPVNDIYLERNYCYKSITTQIPHNGWVSNSEIFPVIHVIAQILSSMLSMTCSYPYAKIMCERIRSGSLSTGLKLRVINQAH